MVYGGAFLILFFNLLLLVLFVFFSEMKNFTSAAGWFCFRKWP